MAEPDNQALDLAEPTSAPIAADPDSFNPGDSGFVDDDAPLALQIDEPYQPPIASRQGRSGSKASVGSKMSKGSKGSGVFERKLSIHKYTESPVITRLHMLEFASQKEWWYEGQNALGFTTVLWFVYIYIMYTRAGVLESYDSQLSVAQHMENIVAHPHLSGIRVRAPEKDPLPCRCACQSSSAGMPKGPCDASASESLNFLGELPAGSPRLPQFSTAALTSANINPTVLGDKLQAGNDDIAPVSWDSIAKPEHVWFWIEHGFIPDVWKARSQSGGTSLQGLVAQKNLIVGGVRIRQKRASMSATCEDKVPAGLNTFYRSECRASEPSSSSYGPSAPFSHLNINTTQYTNTTVDAFQPSATIEEKGYYDALFDVELNISNALETATYCRKQGWVDGATRELTMQAMTLNGEIGMFAIIDVKFSFPSAGGVQKKVRVQTFQAVGSKIEFVDIIPELIWAGLIILLVRQELVQLAVSIWERRCIDYWLDLWCVCDWVSIFISVLIAIFKLWQIASVGSISEEVAALPRAPFASGLNSTAFDVNVYRTQWQQILDSGIKVYERKSWYQLSQFWYTMILMARFLKGFMAQAKTAMIQLTIATVSWDLYHLFVFFVMLFLNFQLGGHILFGGEIEEWSSLPKSGATSVRMLLGTYPFKPMYEMAPFSAVCWFWGFLITVVFILMNLIFAMVADYFSVVRRMVGLTDPIWVDTINACKDLWWRMGWRKINFQDSEYKVAILENPYQDVVSGLLEVAQVPASMERDAHHTCLGVRLGRRHLEAMSVEGLNKDTCEGYVEATSKGLQELGPDIMAADHLLELVQPHLLAEHEDKKKSMLHVIRGFVSLLRKHHADMDEHCAGLEREVTEDHTALARTLDYLEVNVRKCLEEFERLKAEGVHSLAPPQHAIPRPGTLAALEAQKDSMVAPGALLRAIEQQVGAAQRKKGPQAKLPPMIGDVGHNVTASMLMNSPGCNTVGRLLGNTPTMAALRDAPKTNMTALTSGNVQPPVPPSNMAMLSNAPAAQVMGNSAGGPSEGGMLQLRDAGQSDGNAPPAIMDNPQ